MSWENPFDLDNPVNQTARHSYERLRCTTREMFEIRVDGACIAMSRFMTWVYLEADAGPPSSAKARWPDLTTERRLWALGHALEIGMLRLEWPR